MFESLDEIEKQYNLNFDGFKKYQKEILLIFNSEQLNIDDYDFKDSNLLNIIGLYYKYVVKNYELMKAYFSISAEKHNLYAIKNLGYHYGYFEKNNELTKVYYLRAIDLENQAAMYGLGHYYQYVENNCELMLKYYLMVINKNYCSEIINNLSAYYLNNELKFYLLLNNIKNKNELITNKLNELKQYVKIQHYYNKLSLAIELNFTKECIICYNNEYQIIFNCGHYCCKNCFTEIEKCHICKTNF
jgi:hypothetical protein